MARNNWWEDRENLHRNGIDVMYDAYDSAYFFRLEIDVDGRQQYLNQRIDGKTLEEGFYTPERMMDGFQYLNQTRSDYRHPGPTNEELRNPTVRNAWEEFEIVRRLAKR